MHIVRQNPVVENKSVVENVMCFAITGVLLYGAAIALKWVFALIG